MDRVRAALLAGGRGERMQGLGASGLKPLAPFGGVCHLIDFSLSNAKRSGLSEVLLLSQHNELELIRYVLQTWNTGPDFRVHLGPYDGCSLNDCEAVVGGFQRRYEHGTADALINNKAYICDGRFNELLVLHCDHVYCFDYRPMVRFHRDTGAALTLSYQRIERRYVRLFGMVEFDADKNLTQFIEKPQNPKSDMIFAAVCIFDIERLWFYLERLCRSAWRYDISHDVIPAMLTGGERIKGFPFLDYWEDIGTVERYRNAQWRLLDDPPSLGLDAMPRTIRPEISRHLVRTEPGIRNAIVADDLDNKGLIENAIVYPGVRVSPGAVVRNSILLTGAHVAACKHLDDAIVPGERGGS